MTILSGLHVIEISGNGAAAMAGKHLADWGAQVTILEPAEGTPLRNEPPYYEKDGVQKSATWQWLSRGKTAVRAGHGARLTAADAVELCERADVLLVENEMALPVLGLKPSQVRPRFEGKTTCVLISPFATDGPYAHYAATDLGVAALSGWLGGLGDPSREPFSIGRGLTARISGLFALVATLIGLRHVRQGGAPQFVDLSAQAVAASMISAPWLAYSMLDIKPERRGSSWPMGVMECADGYIGCPPLTAGHWEMLCQLMGLEDILELPEGRNPSYRAKHGAELYERVKPWLNARTRAEIFEEAQAWRLPAAPVQTIADRLACPQLEARNFWSSADIDGKTVKVPRVTYAIEGLTPVERGALQEAETVEATATPAAKTGDSAPALPFAGIRVLDLTAFWSGPYATMLLGALGADVIKVESIQRPDSYRYTMAPLGRDRWFEWGPVWNDSNCDKRSITLDLTSETGKELFERLVAQADIVISNFSNRVMPGLGLTNEQLRCLNPRLIAVTMPGYGVGGPWENYVGYAIAFEQLICGSMTGYPDGTPSFAGGFCDPLVGMHVVASIELALRHREETGEGTEVEVPQCEILDSFFAPEQIAVQHGAPVPSRRGNKHDWMAPHDAYRVAGSDRWITIAVASDEEFAALAKVLGKAELARDSRFATVASRKENEAALDAIISDGTREQDPAALERELQNAGVKACRVTKPYLLAEDEGLRHIGFFQQLSREVTGGHPFKRWPFRFSSIDVSHRRPPPLLGEHNGELLTSLLGLSQEELARLERERVIGTAPLGLAS